MSGKVVGLVMERYPGKGGEFGVMLAMAESAHDDGSRVFPAVATVGRKARVCERQARRHIGALKDAGWIILVREGGGRNRASEYRIDIDKLMACPIYGNPQKADTAMSGFSDDINPDISSDKPGHFEQPQTINPDICEKLSTETRTFETVNPDICDTKPGHLEHPKEETRTFSTQNPDIAMSGEPSVTVISTYLYGDSGQQPVDNSPPCLGDVLQLFQTRGVRFRPADQHTRTTVQSWLLAGAGLQDISTAIDKAFLSLGERGPPGPAYLNPIITKIIDDRINPLKQGARNETHQTTSKPDNSAPARVRAAIAERKRLRGDPAGERVIDGEIVGTDG